MALQPAFVYLGKYQFPNLRGADRFPIHEVSVVIAGSQTVNQDTAPNANAQLLIPGCVMGLATGSGSGKYYLVNASATNGATTAKGILMQAVDTSLGDQLGVIADSGAFDQNSLLVAAGDTLSATHIAELYALNIYLEPALSLGDPLAND